MAALGTQRIFCLCLGECWCGLKAGRNSEPIVWHCRMDAITVSYCAVLQARSTAKKNKNPVGYLQPLPSVRILLWFLAQFDGLRSCLLGL